MFSQTQTSSLLFLLNVRLYVCSPMECEDSNLFNMLIVCCCSEFPNPKCPPVYILFPSNSTFLFCFTNGSFKLIIFYCSCNYFPISAPNVQFLSVIKKKALLCNLIIN
uniref:Uncharacterized protein n=1 Tax=Pyxicephalus adspersus TaxID=30357 RepID=A0AAV3B421_PYXAD|nr:TPA: hypothetical protein GDO54_001903 [Pyxicephalus adspersus]